MSTAPRKCPVCGCDHFLYWAKVSTQKKGFSVGKAAVGGILLGPVGLVGGALGKKKSTWNCDKCGFSSEYDG